jgi:hypothetical protein
MNAVSISAHAASKGRTTENIDFQVVWKEALKTLIITREMYKLSLPLPQRYVRGVET